MSYSTIICVGILTVLLSLSGCKDFGVEPTWQIRPGVSVDGIELGFSTAQVEAVLGKPGRIGWVDGAWRTWKSYAYAKGGNTYALTIQFLDTSDAFGPVDRIVMKAGYAGTTQEGIGIGSRAAFVHQMWGQPRKRLAGHDPTDYAYESYCFKGKFFQFLFVSDTVNLMTTGYLLPMPEDTLDTCN